VIAIAYRRCPDCGHEFPPPERKAKHEAQASQAGILSGQVTETIYTVKDTFYSVHLKRGAEETAPRTMRVDYTVGWYDRKSEWICFEHTGYARRKAEAWWRRRSPDPVPVTAEEAVGLANAGALAKTQKITVRSVAGEPFERIVDYELGPMPEAIAATSFDPADIPF
jgi:DNA repair protein RadD